MVDAAKVQSFADRVLALKAQEDEIKKEIREVYAEAVEDEIDKTGLGQLVTHLRKRGKAPEDFDAKEAIFLGYLELYNVAFARTHAYARARTGEIIEGNEPASSEAQVRSERSGEGGEDAPALSADTQSQPERSEAPRQIEAGLVAKVEDQSTAARSNARVMVSRRCEVCGDAFEAVPHEVKRGKARTCSMACAAKLASRPDQTGENNPNWKGGVPSSEIKRTYKDRHPEKAAAHAALTGAIRRRELVRQPCEVCGAADTEGHHDDYSKPLTVRWLCKAHHLEAHHGRFGTQAPPVDTPKKLTKLAPDRADEIGELLDLQQQREAAQ